MTINGAYLAIEIVLGLLFMVSLWLITRWLGPIRGVKWGIPILFATMILVLFSHVLFNVPEFYTKVGVIIVLVATLAMGISMIRASFLYPRPPSKMPERKQKILGAFVKEEK